MHRIDTPTAQKDKFGVGKNGFTTGNPQTGVPATEVSADILDALQEELAAVVEGSGETLDKAKNNQLMTAIKAIIRSTGKAAGLTEYGSALIGVPIDWPLAQMPQDIWPECGAVFLSCAGQAFNKSQYPSLAQAYPSGVLPDLRGEFIRGWDNGRGVDAGRGLLSVQGDAIRNILGTMGNCQLFPSMYRDGAFKIENVSQSVGLAPSSAGTGNGTVNFSLDVSLVVPTANENRPRNIAFHKIMRAA